jgi:hypothetical protein
MCRVNSYKANNNNNNTNHVAGRFNDSFPFHHERPRYVIRPS